MNTIDLFLPAENRGVVIALSGGSDSVALTLMLNDVRERLNIRLYAAHFDHGIRKESGADCDYCRNLCEKLRIPFYTERADIPAICAQTGEGLETAARRLRYDFLRRVKAQTCSDLIALAHHRHDQAETVLMHLLRGCGLDGICGMKPLDGELFRPLLDVPKDELIQYLIEKHIPWREDRTNQIADTPRNALRLNLLPSADQIYPNAAEAITRFADTARRENAFLTRLTNDFLQQNLERGLYGTRLRVINAEPVLLARAVKYLLGADIYHEKITEVATLKAGYVDIDKTRRAFRSDSYLYILPKIPKDYGEARLNLNGETVYGNYVFTCSPAEPTPIKNDLYAQIVDADKLTNARVRLRKKGDRFRPLGTGEKKLSDYMTDKKIDRPLRDALPLIANGNQIMWIPGCGISENIKLDATTRNAVQISVKIIGEDCKNG